MNASEPLIVITAHDVPYQHVPLMESNCACSVDGFSLEDAATSPDSIVPLTLSVLHTDTPTAGSHLTLDPLGKAGVVVLNEPTPSECRSSKLRHDYS